MLRFFSKAHSLKLLPLKPYRFNFSLDRLVSGVDNIRTDVNVSAQVHSAAAEVAGLLLLKHSKSDDLSEIVDKRQLDTEKEKLKRLCSDILLDGIHKAKSDSEVQIDWLAQVSLAKILHDALTSQFQQLIAKIEKLVRNYQLSTKHDQGDIFRLKEKLADIKQQKKHIARLAGEEMFQLMEDVNTGHLKNIRESNYPHEDILPDNFFSNPMLHTDSITDDYFLIADYVLLSQRSEDPDNYNNLVFIIHDILSRTDLCRETPAEPDDSAEDAQKDTAVLRHPDAAELDQWLMQTDNINLMLNYPESEEGYRRLKHKKDSQAARRDFKDRASIQRRLVKLFYRKFKDAKLIERVVATFEVQALYRNYCPPLQPWQVLEYLVKPASRKQIVRQLKRLKSFYGNSFSLSPLNKTIRRIKRSPRRKNQQYLLAFLARFARYHRDLKNFKLLKNAMEGISLLREEKILTLSRENRRLYEFLLPGERITQEKAIINHVIIKADIRGSTDITYQMKDRGLNPASYFSLNFFDPISEVLFEYGGRKEFIEGDAIILSIFEKDDTPEGWYGVARACGLAIRILRIVRQYNINSQRHRLPILELGIGICYHDSAPAFLFDGDARIMISPAINQADRLSSCDKELRKYFKASNQLFNLFVFQSATAEDLATTTDDLSLRYNINGIELNPAGFAKLSREINLKKFTYPLSNEKIELYVGKFPTMNGKYQHLVIREAHIETVAAGALKTNGRTANKYYEVCSHPRLYEVAAEHF